MTNPPISNVNVPAGRTVPNLVTVTGTRGNGYIVAYPHPGDVPSTSTLNCRWGQTVANHAIVPVNPSFAFANAEGTTHLIVDVFGYFT